MTMHDLIWFLNRICHLDWMRCNLKVRYAAGLKNDVLWNLPKLVDYENPISGQKRLFRLIMQISEFMGTFWVIIWIKILKNVWGWLWCKFWLFGYNEVVKWRKQSLMVFKGAFRLIMREKRELINFRNSIKIL